MFIQKIAVPLFFGDYNNIALWAFWLMLAKKELRGIKIILN